jgi:hypothetical protein
MSCCSDAGAWNETHNATTTDQFSPGPWTGPVSLLMMTPLIYAVDTDCVRWTATADFGSRSERFVEKSPIRFVLVAPHAINPVSLCNLFVECL